MAAASAPSSAGPAAATAAAGRPLAALARQGSSSYNWRRRALSTAAAAAAPLGAHVRAVETPALVLDLDAFERKARRLRDALVRAAAASPSPAGGPVTVRPHAKAHKCPQLARLQLHLLGPDVARGVCAQKLSEVEALVMGGVGDVALTNQAVDPAKQVRLAWLAATHPWARLSVVVDAPGPAAALAAACADAASGAAASPDGARGGAIDVLVEVNAGQDRCGVDSPDAAAALAAHVAELAEQTRGAVRFAGLQAYHGGIQHVRSRRARADAAARAAERAAAAVEAVRARAGLACGVVTGGGSGTWRRDAASGVFTEVQPGSLFFGDADYARNEPDDDDDEEQGSSGGGGGSSGSSAAFEQSLWVLTQAMSDASAARAPSVVVDAGLKALALDSGPPMVLEAPNIAAGLVVAAGSSGSSSGSSSGGSDGSDGCGGSSTPSHQHQPPPPPPPEVSFDGGVEYKCAGDEHGLLLWPRPGALHALPPPLLPPVGAKLLLQPGHVDPTFNLYDALVLLRGWRVAGVWPIAARGPGL